MDNVTIGQAVRRTEDLRFLTGAGSYIDDMWRAIEAARARPGRARSVAGRSRTLTPESRAVTGE